MNINLTPDLEKLISEKINTGRYQSPNEVIREGLMLLQEKDQLREIKLKQLRQDIQEGIDSGDSVTFDLESIKTKAKNNI